MVIVDDSSMMLMNASFPTCSIRSTRIVAGPDGAGDDVTEGDGLTTGGTTAGSRSNQPPIAAPATAAASSRPTAATSGSG